MAYLNKDERAKLQSDLDNLKFNQANGRLKRMDSEGRLVYYRSAQRVGQWWTRYELNSLGTMVTLVEWHWDEDTLKANRMKSEFELVEVVVEPTPDNRT
ncbi:MAG: hypothetical protein K8L99_04480 [Anaerolineae bacterium]|nr:hypothetical protein [Anaerolineae bacterium]